MAHLFPAPHVMCTFQVMSMRSWVTPPLPDVQASGNTGPPFPETGSTGALLRARCVSAFEWFRCWKDKTLLIPYMTSYNWESLRPHLLIKQFKISASLCWTWFCPNPTETFDSQNILHNCKHEKVRLFHILLTQVLSPRGLLPAPPILWPLLWLLKDSQDP